MSAPKPLSSVAVHRRCLGCASLEISRSCEPTSLVSMNGASLWTLTERCTMCQWELTTTNVKLGA